MSLKSSVLFFQAEAAYSIFVHEVLEREFTLVTVSSQNEFIEAAKTGTYRALIVDIDRRGNEALDAIFQVVSMMGEKVPTIIAISDRAELLKKTEHLRRLGIKALLLKTDLADTLLPRINNLLFAGPAQRNPRVFMAVPVKYGQGDQLQQSKSFTLSPAGVFVHSAKPAQVNEIYDLSLRLPAGGQILQLRGKVLYNIEGQSKSTGTHPTGIAFGFVNLNAQQLRLLHQTVHQAV